MKPREVVLLQQNNNLPFPITLYRANCRGNVNNNNYPIATTPTDALSLKSELSYDHTFIQFKGNRRSLDNFESITVITADCDNDHSENEDDWYTVDDIHVKYSDVKHIIVTSRNHMKQKGNKSPRPRFHIIFWVGTTLYTPEEYTKLITRIQSDFPIFDSNALDAARFFFANPDTEVFVHNGTLSIMDYLNKQDEAERAFVNIGEHIAEGSRNTTMHQKAVCLLKRYGNTEESKTKYLQEADKCSPPLADQELQTIWNSACKFYKTKILTNPDYEAPEVYNGSKELVWETPIPFDTLSVPTFPIDAFPPDIRDYAIALAENTQTPVDMAAISILAVTSICMQKKYVITIKPGWKEQPNIFLLCILEPSERKSADLNGTSYVLHEYEAEYNRINAPAIESSKMRKRILEKRQKVLEDQAAKGKAELSDLDKIAEEIANFREKKPLKLYMDDVTTEKVTSVMAENDGHAAILSTEGGIFDILAGIYTRNVNIDAILKGYSGDPIRVDRIGRNSETVMNPSLTMMLMVQPHMLSGIMSNSTFRGRGLTARFLYCMPKSFIGKRKYRSNPIPTDVQRRYESIIRNMLDDEYPVQLEEITLSPEADILIEEFANELEPKLNTEYADIKDWAGKLVGNIARISALLCRASVYRSHDFLADIEPLVVTEETMENAISIGRYYLEHAKAAFSLMGADNTINTCKYVLKAIKSAGLTEFTRRDIMRLCRSLKKAEDVQPVLDHLVEYGYIALKDADNYSGKGRRPAAVYLVNPHLYDTQD